MNRTAAAAAIGVCVGAVLAGCSSETPSPAASSGPHVFDGQWDLTGTVRFGADTSLPPYPAPDGAEITWRHGVLTGSDGCNHFAGSYRAGGAELTIADFRYVAPIAPCPSVNSWTQILGDTNQWSVAGGLLTITGEQAGTLTFRADRN